MSKFIKQAVLALFVLAAACTNSPRKKLIAAGPPATKAVPSSATNTQIIHGYLVASYTVKDQQTYQRYRKMEESIAAKFRGKVILYDANTAPLEGNPLKVIDIIEFPSSNAAKHFYQSTDYAPAKKDRVASTEGWVLLAVSPPALLGQADSITKYKNRSNGYLVVNYTISDPATFKKYMAAAGPLAQKFKGTVPIFDLKTQRLEGNPYTVFGIAAFPLPADAQRFYSSPEYTSARKFRTAASTGTNQLASTVPPSK